MRRFVSYATSEPRVGVEARGELTVFDGQFPHLKGAL